MPFNSDVSVHFVNFMQSQDSGCGVPLWMGTRGRVGYAGLYMVLR